MSKLWNYPLLVKVLKYQLFILVTPYKVSLIIFSIYVSFYVWIKVKNLIKFYYKYIILYFLIQIAKRS